MSSAAFPFSAVVGQDEAKLALLLAAGQPLLGGVLLRGDKGSAKTTLARGLAAVLGADAPFVELPLGATEDRVIGSIDLAALLSSGEAAVRPGLLAAAHGGVLYVDEINLLADHLVDSLLDVASSGINRIERDGIAHTHPARFILIGSMNPEEGELRPQLLDRFGFAVDVRTSTDPTERAAAVRRRLEFDAGDHAVGRGAAGDAALRRRLADLRPASVPDGVIDIACRVALSVGAEGLRADVMLCRGAAAHAAWDGRTEATVDDVRAVAAFVLAHRRRRSPLEPPGIDDDEIDHAFDDAETAAGSAGDEQLDEPAPPSAPPTIIPPRTVTRARVDGRRGNADGTRGRFVRSERIEDMHASTISGASLAIPATAVAVAERRVTDPGSPVSVADLRAAVRSQRTGNLVILCVDASGSMGAEQRMAMAKGAVLGLLTDAYQRRDRIALVTFAGDSAAVVLRPTASVEIAQARLRELPTGGTSPIAEGLDAALRISGGASGDQALEPLLVVITDGRATGSADAVERSLATARRIAEARIAAVVVDAESGAARLGLGRELADAMGATHLALGALADGSLERTIRLRLS
ncbi:MAG TPA: AAA family ATPase [Ilumatobacteraceae bacterium]